MKLVAGALAGDDAVLKSVKMAGADSISTRMLVKAKKATDKLDDPNSLAANIVRNVYFNSGIHTSILLSAVFMGVQTQMGHSANSHNSLFWYVIENVFTTIFALEMFLKVYVLRRVYFLKFWNLMDFSIAWLSIFDSWVLPAIANTKEGSVDLHLFKIFRLLRLSRMLRFLNAIPELRMVVEGLAASMRALFWVTLLLFIVVYAFSIFCVEIVGDESKLYPGYSKNVTTADNFNPYEYFGTLSRSVISLLSLTFMAEWSAMRAVWEVQWWVTLVFLCLIFISSFGIVNVIIGVIVEKITMAMQEHQSDQNSVRKGEVFKHFQEVADKLFDEIEGLGITHGVSREEMCTIAQDNDMTELFSNVEFPAGFSFDDLYTMLNIDGVGDLNKQEFLTGMRRLLFSNPTQKVCISHLSLGQIKELLQAFWSSHNQAVDELKQEILDLKDCVNQALTLVMKSEATAGEGVSPISQIPPKLAPKSSPKQVPKSPLMMNKTGSFLAMACLEPPGTGKDRRWEGRGSVRTKRRLKTEVGLLIPSALEPTSGLFSIPSSSSLSQSPPASGLVPAVSSVSTLAATVSERSFLVLPSSALASDSEAGAGAAPETDLERALPKAAPSTEVESAPPKAGNPQIHRPDANATSSEVGALEHRFTEVEIREHTSEVGAPDAALNGDSVEPIVSFGNQGGVRAVCC